MLISQIIPPKAKQGELPLIFFNDSTIIIELERIIAEINHNGPINNDDLEKLSYIKEFHNELFEKYESSLMFSLGLFYKTSIPKTIWDLAFGTYAKAIEIELNGIYTPVQASAFKQIDSNKYFSFSAPTSAGKSHLFRKLIKDEKGDILIILPSRALIAEYLILVKESLKDEKDVLVLQFIEDVNQAKTSRRVYIVTPERCKELFRELSKPNNRIHISLALFDEAQISEEPIRGIRFDSLVRRINRTIDGVKIVFTHPFIENPEAQLSKHNNEFSGQSSSLSYDQNAVGKIFFFTKESKFFYFSPYELKKRLYDEADIDCVKNKLIQGKTLLVYVSKKSIYDHTFRKDFEVYIDCCPKITNLDGIAIIDELKEYLGVTDSKGDKYSLLIDLMGQGVVIHHGSIPLRARLLIEKFIKEEHAKICFSTSTLQQGVNMPFDMVWIDNFRFDGNGRKDKDVDDRIKSLALKNLIGRAGRSSNEKKDFFDYGYVIIEYKNLPKFIQRLNISPTISSNSLLDSDFTSVDEDVQDIVEAIKNNSFDDETNLTKSQLDRLSNEETMNNVKYILDTLFPEGIILAGEQYYDLGDYKRRKIQTAFKDIYVAHLRRKELKSAEKGCIIYLDTYIVMADTGKII